MDLQQFLRLSTKFVVFAMISNEPAFWGRRIKVDTYGWPFSVIGNNPSKGVYLTMRHVGIICMQVLVHMCNKVGIEGMNLNAFRRQDDVFEVFISSNSGAHYSHSYIVKGVQKLALGLLGGNVKEYWFSKLIKAHLSPSNGIVKSSSICFYDSPGGVALYNFAVHNYVKKMWPDFGNNAKFIAAFSEPDTALLQKTFDAGGVKRGNVLIIKK